MSSFVRYILKFKDHNCAYGDVARDILADPEVNRRWGYRSFVNYLAQRNASQRVFELVDEINWNYKEMKTMGFF